MKHLTIRHLAPDLFDPDDSPTITERLRDEIRALTASQPRPFLWPWSTVYEDATAWRRVTPPPIDPRQFGPEVSGADALPLPCDTCGAGVAEPCKWPCPL